MIRPLTKEDIQKIRNEVIRGKSKFKVSKEMHLNQTTVCKYTKDLPNKVKREPYISGKTLELLKEVHRERICIHRRE